MTDRGWEADCLVSPDEAVGRTVERYLASAHYTGEPELLKFERERIAERPQHSEDAYEFYQRGLWHHYCHTKEDNNRYDRDLTDLFELP